MGMDRNGKLGGFTYQSSAFVMGREIRVQMYETQKGICIVIEGGDLGHIGAIAFSSPDTEAHSFTFPGHKETVVCERWLKEIRRLCRVPVVVLAGIHYDGITREEIRQLLEALEEELYKISLYLRSLFPPAISDPEVRAR